MTLNDSVILFDGVCNLCNSSVNFVIEHDPDGFFKLGTLQSEKAHKYLASYDLENDEIITVILIENGKVFTKSDAALRIAKQLRGPVKLAWIFIILPRFIRDPVYNWISRNRYSWFGKRKQCRVPTPELKNRFI